MTFGPMVPYTLSIGIIILGSIPALFLPETLKHPKQTRVNQEASEQDSESEQSQPPRKQTVLQEVTRQVREFARSTRFIWTDTKICLMVFVMFVTMMTRQSTNLLLQYVSKKFDWSISRVCALSPQSNNKKKERKKTNHDIGQSLNLAARDIFSRDIFGHNANPVVLSHQTPKPPWKTLRPFYEQRQRRAFNHWIRHYLHSSNPCDLNRWSSHLVNGLSIHYHHTQSGYFTRAN